jgi:hypothetical protein
MLALQLIVAGRVATRSYVQNSVVVSPIIIFRLDKSGK